MLRLLSTVIVLCSSGILSAQNFDTTHYRNNVVYFEGFGNPYPGWSLNYERALIQSNKSFISLRTGFAYAFSHDLTCPMLINRVSNKRQSNHLEFGGGVTLYFYGYRNGSIKLEQEFNPTITGNLTYRYQKPGGKFIFRASWTPSYFIGMDDSLIKYLMFFIVGGSVGYAF